MNIGPNTIIKLLNVPICIDNKNQLTFENSEKQFNYFNSKIVHSFLQSSFNYVREGEFVKVPKNIEELYDCNYIMYKNSKYTNKWFYAFITKIEYVNPNVTKIYFTTDVFQSFQFDFQMLSSFIEREHVENDEIGLNTINENLNVGEVMEIEETHDLSYENCYVAVMSTYNPSNKKDFQYITQYNRQIFGSNIFLFPEANAVDLGLFIAGCNEDKKSQSIESIFFVPEACIKLSDLILYEGTYGGQSYSFWGLKRNTKPELFNTEIQKPKTFTDYIPKNNKCFCYPYNYLFVTNCNGNDNIYKYEDFYSDSCIFENEVAISQGGSGQIVPLNYKKIIKNFDESLPLGKYPTCGWSEDSYISWLTSQAVNIPTQIASAGTNTVSSIAKKDFAVGYDSVAGTTSNLIGQFYSASLLPNVSHGGNTADVNFSLGNVGFKFRQMRAKKEYLETIDNYFTMFGYKVNALKVPNYKSRKNWNYVQTVDCNLKGAIPQQFLIELKSIFNSGVTFWHNPETFGDYNQDNSII